MQRAREVTLSCQDIPRRDIGHKGVKTRAYRRNSSRKGVLSLEMRMLRGHLRVEELSQRKSSSV